MGQLTPDQAAEMLLNSARKAYNEKNYPFAAGKFREFLAKAGGHKDAPAARYGLALVLIEGFDKNYNEARELLQNVAAVKDFADRPFVLYYLGLAVRGQGIAELQQAEGKPPPEAQNRKSAAAQRFGEAANFFAQALDLFTQQWMAMEPPKGAELTGAAEWAARARCDLAEAQLRQGKHKDAQATSALFLKHPVLTRSRFRGNGLYYYGFASLLLKDIPQAQKSLSLLAPFNEPVFGNHARYLLARAHHLADERTEAAAHYDAVVADYVAGRRKPPSNCCRKPRRSRPIPSSVPSSRRSSRGRSPTTSPGRSFISAS